MEIFVIAAIIMVVAAAFSSGYGVAFLVGALMAPVVIFLLVWLCAHVGNVVSERDRVKERLRQEEIHREVMRKWER